jgi:trigger factor
LKIIKQEKSGNKVKLEIEVAYSSFKSMSKRAFDEAASTLAIPGFRKGKAPKNISEQYLNQDAINDRAAQNLISDLYPQIIKETNIEPVDYPNVVVKNLKEKEPFVFSLEVAVYPEVKLGKYKGIKIESESEEVTEKELSDFIGGLRERVAKLEEVVGRGIENEDIVEIDVAASSGEEDVKSLSGNKVGLVIGRGQFTPEFDEQLKGLTVGAEKQFELKIPDSHPVKDVAGKAVKFRVLPKKISRRQLPPLDDEFAKEIANAPSLEEFNKNVKQRLAESKKAQVEAEVKNKSIEEVAKGISADIPEGMIRRETDLMVDELKGTLAKDRMTYENYLRMTRKSEKEVRDQFKKGAEARVKSKLALRAIALKENLELKDEDIDAEIKVLAGSSGEKPDKFRSTVGESGMEYIKDYLLRRKALEFIIANAKISTKK